MKKDKNINWKEVVVISLIVSLLVCFPLITISNYERKINLLNLDEDVGYQLCSESVKSSILICDDNEAFSIFNHSIDEINKFVEGCKKIIVSDYHECVGEIIIYRNGGFTN